MLGQTEVEVMSKSGQKRGLVLAGLIRIDFPRMHVEDRGRPVATICLIEQPTGHAVRKETEIAAARSRDVDPKYANRGQRYLNHARDRRESSAGRARAPIEVMF